MTELSSKEKAALRGAAQRLKPAIFVGKGGVSPRLIDEMNRVFASEPLVKVAFKANREELGGLIAELEAGTGACCVGGVGKRRSFYRAEMKA